MTHDPNSLQRLWQDQPLTLPPLDVEQVRRRAERFHGLITRRNVVEFSAAGLVVVTFGGMALNTKLPLLSRVGCGLTLPAMIFILIVLWRRGRAEPLPAGESMVQHLSALSESLERQACLLDDAWRWYLAPLVPSLFLFNAGLLIERPHPSPFSWVVSVGAIAIQAVVFWGIGVANKRAARRLRHERALLREP